MRLKTRHRGDAARGVLGRAAPGVTAMIAAMASIGPLAAGTLVWLDASRRGGIDQTILAAGIGFAVVAVVIGVGAARRVRAAATVADAVRAVHANPVGRGEAMVDPSLGAAAQAWNELAARLTSGEPGAAVLHRRGGDAVPVAVLESIHDGLVLLDRRGEVVASNGAARVLLALNGDAVTLDMIRGAIGKDAAAGLEQAFAGQAPRSAIVERRADGALTQQMRIRVLPAGVGKEFVLIMISDTTRQAAADAATSVFLAQAAHELRAPLTNIKLYVDQAIVEGDDDPSLRIEALNVVAGEALRLDRIVADLLRISELESGARRSEIGDVRIEQMLSDLRAAFEARASEKGIAFSFDVSPKMPVLKGDRDQVMMMFQNLVGNAIKYTPDGGSVTVRADADERQFTLDVIDTGIGIAPAEASLVFDKFFRSADERIRGVEGSGLGLAFAREVARQHGGEITVDSELNRGSTFTLRLPVNQAA
jgi:two-component system sensor histidine kinase VicK